MDEVQEGALAEAESRLEGVVNELASAKSRIAELEGDQQPAEDGEHIVHTLHVPFGAGTLHVETETDSETPRLRIVDDTHGIVAALMLSGGHWNVALHPAVMGAPPTPDPE